jgi:hypothetical protein
MIVLAYLLVAILLSPLFAMFIVGSASIFAFLAALLLLIFPKHK